MLALLGEAGGIAPVKALAHLPEPDSRSHGEPELVRGVECFAQIIVAPQADGIAARSGQRGQRFLIPPAAFYEVGLAIAEQLKAPAFLHQSHLGAGRSDGKGEYESR